MDIDEYHAFEPDEDDDTKLGTCRYCGTSFGDHEDSCPLGEPDDYDEPDARGREEDRVYSDLRERWQGP